MVGRSSVVNKKLILVFALILGAAGAFGEAVAFQIIQRDESDARIRVSSYSVENNLFDYFFDKGIIVSNSPVCCSKTEQNDRIIFMKALEECREGGVDYFVEFIAEFNNTDVKNPDALYLENIKSYEWTIIDVDTDRKIGSGKISGPEGNSKDVNKGIFDFSYDMADQIYKSIKNYR